MQNIKNYIPQYKKYLIDQAKSENTIKTYVGDIMQYNLEFPYINRDSVLKYKKMLGELSSKTVNRKLSSLKSFNEFLLSEGIVSSLYVIKADFAKFQQQCGNPTDITNEQIKEFINKVKNTRCMFQSRNMTLVYLIANTGIRREEASNIKIKNIDFEKGELIVVGKGNKQREVLLNNKTIEIIKNYLVDREKQFFASSPYLFISERAKKLHKDTINNIFESYSTSELKIKPHGLRHAYSSSMIENDVLTLPELQSQLGHSNISVTSRYLHARKDNIKKKINNFSIG